MRDPVEPFPSFPICSVVFDVPGTAEVVLRYSTSYGEYSANARKVFTVEVSSGD